MQSQRGGGGGLQQSHPVIADAGWIYQIRRAFKGEASPSGEQRNYTIIKEVDEKEEHQP